MTAKEQQGFIFDLNGTLVRDMDYHIRAWREIVNGLGANLSYDEVKRECYGKNADLLDRVFPGRFSDAEKDEIGMNKEKAYQQAFRPVLKLIEGAEGFIRKANDLSIPMGIGSAAIRFNIDFVIDNTGIARYFSSIVSADDVKNSKPDPETFLSNAAELKLLPENCIVFEDAPKGVEAAAHAGMNVVVLTTMHEAHEFSAYDNVLFFIENYHNSLLEKLLQ